MQLPQQITATALCQHFLGDTHLRQSLANPRTDNRAVDSFNRTYLPRQELHSRSTLAAYQFLAAPQLPQEITATALRQHFLGDTHLRQSLANPPTDNPAFDSVNRTYLLRQALHSRSTLATNRMGHHNI